MRSKYGSHPKAHSALRWLISRQGWYDGDLVVLAWSPGLLKVPSPCGNVQEWEHYTPDQPTPNDQVTQLVKQFKKNSPEEERAAADIIE